MPGDYAENFRELLTLHDYGGGDQVDHRLPHRLRRRPVGPAAVRSRRGRGALADSGGGRLTDRAHAFRVAPRTPEMAKPLQLHVGFGDRDCDLHRTNSSPTDFLRTSGETPVVLLHCYPFEREAGYLAPGLQQRLRRYRSVRQPSRLRAGRSSPEVSRWRRFGRFCTRRTVSAHRNCTTLDPDCGAMEFAGYWENSSPGDEWSEADAMRIAKLIGRDNAARVYHLTR